MDRRGDGLRRSERLACKTPAVDNRPPGLLSCVDKRRRREPDCNYINELPDEILQDILSRLKVKEAVKTCAVSRRWRNLWTLSAGEASSSFYSRQYYEYASSGVIVVRYKERASWTKKDSMILAFDTEKDGRRHVYSRMNEWIQTILVPTPPLLETSDRLEAARLAALYCKTNLRPPVLDTSGRLQTARLTALYLDSVSMDSEKFKDCTRLCPSLETLVVVNAGLGSAIVDSACEKLKHLEFRHCKHLRFIDFYAGPNLESFKLAASKKQRCNISVSGSIPNLATVSLQVCFSVDLLRKFRRAAPQLKQLELRMEDLLRRLSVSDPALGFPEFSNVRQLKLIFDFSSNLGLMDLALFIKACPRLQKLTLMYARTGKPDAGDHKYVHYDEESMKSYAHQHLEVVEFLGWRGHESEARFADFVIQTASHLQDLVFPPHHLDDKKAVECARQLIEKFKMIKSSRP